MWMEVNETTWIIEKQNTCIIIITLTIIMKKTRISYATLGCSN